MAFEYKSDNLRLEIDNDAPIARMYINRPDKLNAITMTMRGEIVRFFEMIEDDERIRVVLSHELAHVRRNDWAVHIAADVVRRLYWFQPLMWIACRQLRR